MSHLKDFAVEMAAGVVWCAAVGLAIGGAIAAALVPILIVARLFGVPVTLS